MVENITCRIWAQEEDPRNGSAHSCHASFNGLHGQSHLKDKIEEKLETTPVWIKTMKWRLVACEPNHDGKACGDCQYSYRKGLSYCHDLELQKQALQKSGVKLEYPFPKESYLDLFDPQ
ncbi:hypothetical protein GOV13_04785 [Candidatus Pacearchaeota archaeon]|nr:hypothetical protein [Candidatus Pacearchaeota archaeon]